jgi:hypothetical protein
MNEYYIERKRFKMRCLFKKLFRSLVCCITFVAIIILSVNELSAEPLWSSFSLSPDISIEKITPALHGVYFISNIGQNGGPLSYYNFQERKYSLLEDGFVKLSFNCAITKEGYVVVVTGAAAITSLYSEGTWLKGYGTGGITDSGISFADVVITGEQSYVFIYYEGAFKVTGEKYNNLEKLPWYPPGWRKELVTGHNETLWCSCFDHLIASFEIARIEKNILSQTILIEGLYKGFYCDNKGILWIATSKGLFCLPSDVPLEPWSEKNGYARPDELKLSPSYTGPPPNSVVCDASGRTLVGTPEDGLYLYDGSSWTHITKSDGLSDNAITCVGVDPHNRFYAAGKNWFASENLIPDKVAEGMESSPLIINPPYPNPANSFTTISYSLASPSNVRLDIYSANGQKVATLIDGVIGSGKHAVKIDGSKYSSGLYFYRFTIEKFTRTGKMLLLK